VPSSHVPVFTSSTFPDIEKISGFTVFTQRLKLSGMHWKKAGTQNILTLRTILLSNTWAATYAMLLSTREASLPMPYAAERWKTGRKAA